jgi:hypothetical protein
MNPLVKRILELSGPMPDATAHQRWLETLTPVRLHARLAALENDLDKPVTLARWSEPRRETAARPQNPAMAVY